MFFACRIRHVYRVNCFSVAGVSPAYYFLVRHLSFPLPVILLPHIDPVPRLVLPALFWFLVHHGFANLGLRVTSLLVRVFFRCLQL